MSSLTTAFLVGLLIAVSGMAGLELQRLLPAGHTTERSRDMIGGVVGLLTLLLAVTLGLLIWTSYGVFSTQQKELQTIAARALEFDIEMREYGPEGDRAREILRRDLVWAHQQFWGDERSQSKAYDASVKAMADMSGYFNGLKPATPAQTHLLDLARANYAFIGENRILMSMEARTPVSWPLIQAVTAWSCLMFGGIGLLSRPNATTVAMLAVGAASIGLAIFLIIELGKPYTSSIRVSPAALEEAIVRLSQPEAAASPAAVH